jgi:amino acid adenylation domain-containing protein
MIVKGFEEISLKNAHRIAIKTQEEMVTYRFLNKRANQLAHTIKRYYPLEKTGNKEKKHKNVALLLERGIDLIVGQLGVLKSQRTYVSLDMTYPNQRLAEICEFCDISLLITHSSNQEVSQKLVGTHNQRQIKILYLDNIPEEESDRNPDMDIHGESLAYILFTSGSTGKPKAVMQTHKNVGFFTKNYIKWLEISPGDRVTFLSSVAHDGAVQDIFTALLSGATLLPFNVREQGVEDITKWMFQEKITVYHSVVTLFRYIASTIRKKEEEQFPLLRVICLGGEKLRIDDIRLVREYFPETRLAHMYGQAESSLNTIGYIDTNQEQEAITIGRPLQGISLLLINEQGEEVEELEEGEIFLASPYLSPGYWDHPEANRISYFEDEEYGRMYKTGDLGVLLLNGGIEFRGRKDLQVKVRGFRVEPNEIASTMLKLNTLEEVVVKGIIKDGENHLCAYILPDKDFEMDALREYVSRELPDYMIPSYYVQLKEIPRTSSGKVNLQALPEPGNMDIEEGDYEAPENDLEKKLVNIWSEILNIDSEKISINTSFFRLGGHSLKAAILSMRIHKDFNTKITIGDIFANPSIREMATYIKKTGQTTFHHIQPVEQKEYYPLTSAQKRLFFLQELTPLSTSYNIPIILSMGKDVEIEKIEQILRILIQKHEALRTSFFYHHDEAVQRVERVGNVQKKAAFSMDYIDAGETPVTQAIGEYIKPFDLKKAPLMRSGIIDCSGGQRIWMLYIHHIVSDGTSMNVLIRDFSDLYQNQETFDPFQIQYKDYADGQHKKTTSDNENFKNQEEYWLSQFEGEIPQLEIPSDFPRPLEQRFIGNKESFVIEGNEATGLKTMVSEQETTMFMLLLGIFTILLSKMSGKEDIIVGTPVAGRKHADIENTIGMFVNTLCLRNFPSGNTKFLDYIKDVKDRTLDAFENQDYQYEDLVDKVSIKRVLNRNPLFDVMLAMHNFDLIKEGLSGLPLTPIENEKPFTKFDMTWDVHELEQEIRFGITYDADLYKPATINRFIKHFNQLVKEVLGATGKKLSDLELLTKQEREQILYIFNNTKIDYPEESTILDLYQNQVKKSPNSVAVIFKDHSITYQELDEKTDQLATILNHKKIGGDTIVGLMAERSMSMIIGIYGILKAGGAYMPIDPLYPQDRINFMLTDSTAGVLIVSEETKLSLKSIETIEISDTLFPPTQPCQSQLPGLSIQPIQPNHIKPEKVTPSHLAYMIYTSGSTGKPKGVVIEQGSLVNRLNWMQKTLHLDRESVLIQKTPITFDVSVWELFWWSITGASITVLEPGGEKDPSVLVRTIEKNNVSVIHFVPSMLSVFLEYLETEQQEGRVSGLKRVIASGEALTPSLVNHFNALLKEKNGTTLENLYGPTEATIDVSYFPCSNSSSNPNSERETKNLEKVPIGKPIDNTQLFILDKYEKLQPIGITGELVISGKGLARGYLNRPELTQEKFVNINKCDNKWGQATGSATGFCLSPIKYYRTGDLARWQPDDDPNIEFLGRIDLQVKIRGFRIELGEIQAHLLNHHTIKEAVVIDRENSTREKEGKGKGKEEKYLCAYIVEEEPIDITEIKTYLSSKIPGYMIPSYFLTIKEIPLTANGKIDRKSLPDPKKISAKRKGSQPPASASPQETTILEIWADVLGYESNKISVEDDFFDLGGNSITILKVRNRLSRHFNRDIPLSSLFVNTTIRDLFASILEEKDNGGQAKKMKYVVKLNKGKHKKNIFIFHPMHGMVFPFRELAKQLEDRFNVYGIQSKGQVGGQAQKEALPRTYDEIVKSYLQEIKAVQPEGPYILLGYCIGNKLAYETASQMEKQGETIKRVILLDVGIFAPQKMSRFFEWRYYIEHRLIGHHIASKTPPPDYTDEATEEQKQLINRIKTNHQRIFQEYKYKGIIHAPLIHIRAQENLGMFLFQRTWKKMSKGKVKLFYTTGNHHNILKNPHVQKIADIIKATL